MFDHIAAAPFIFAAAVIVGTLIVLRLRAIAIRPQRQSDDEWAEEAQGMFYARTGRREVTAADIYGPRS